METIKKFIIWYTKKKIKKQLIIVGVLAAFFLAEYLLRYFDVPKGFKTFQQATFDSGEPVRVGQIFLYPDGTVGKYFDAEDDGRGIIVLENQQFKVDQSTDQVIYGPPDQGNVKDLLVRKVVDNDQVFYEVYHSYDEQFKRIKFIRDYEESEWILTEEYFKGIKFDSQESKLFIQTQNSDGTWAMDVYGLDTYSDGSTWDANFMPAVSVISINEEPFSYTDNSVVEYSEETYTQGFLDKYYEDIQAWTE